MICALCAGMGSRFTLQCGRQWWPCQACAGTGSRVLHGSGAIAIGAAQGRFVRPESRLGVDITLADAACHDGATDDIRRSRS